jgi:ketosteroid isomerase-like protein
MSYEVNRATIERLLAATRDRDESAFAAAYTDDALVRQSGVPESLGGVLRGRDAIAENFRRQDPFAIEVRLTFGDESHVCVVGKLSGIVSGTEKLKGTNQPFSTYECAVYTFRDGLIEHQLIFVNWLDAYVQADLVSLSDLLTS